MASDLRRQRGACGRRAGACQAGSGHATRPAHGSESAAKCLWRRGCDEGQFVAPAIVLPAPQRPLNDSYSSYEYRPRPLLRPSAPSATSAFTRAGTGTSIVRPMACAASSPTRSSRRQRAEQMADARMACRARRSCRPPRGSGTSSKSSRPVRTCEIASTARSAVSAARCSRRVRAPAGSRWAPTQISRHGGFPTRGEVKWHAGAGPVATTRSGAGLR
jgi:hypothetical protein